MSLDWAPSTIYSAGPNIPTNILIEIWNYIYIYIFIYMSWVQVIPSVTLGNVTLPNNLL